MVLWLTSLTKLFNLYRGDDIVIKKGSIESSQQTHYVATTLQRRCKVTTLQRRCNDVVVRFVCWGSPIVKA